MGKSDYTAHAGCCTWLNGVYWIRVLETLPNGRVLIENLHDVGKIKVERVQTVVEADLVYPLLRGRDALRWRAEPSVQLLLVQDPERRAAIPEARMKVEYPKGYAYLRRFEEQLRLRSGYRKYFDSTDPFYSMYDVGAYSMGRWRVVWAGEVALSLNAAVLESTADGRPVLNDQTAYQVACESGDEAHLLCSVLNSDIVRAYYGSVAYKHTSMHFIQQIRIPHFDAANALHQRLVDLSRQCHEAAKIDAAETLKVLERQVDEAAAQLWGLTEAELQAIQEALRDK
jgi:hypothetical protein